MPHSIHISSIVYDKPLLLREYIKVAMCCLHEGHEAPRSLYIRQTNSSGKKAMYRRINSNNSKSPVGGAMDKIVLKNLRVL